VRVSRCGPLRRQVCSGTRARGGGEQDAMGAASRMSRRRHYERNGHQSVNTRWHEYRAAARDVKTKVVTRGVDIDKHLGIMPHRGSGHYWVAEEAYAIQSASFRAGAKETGSSSFW
jgi:hypothetical protein